MATKPEKSFGSLEKAIRILCLFDSETPGLSAQEISKNLNTPLSTTYNYLKVFLQSQILTKDERTKKYRLGFRIFKLGILASEHFSLPEIARPYLEYIARHSQETVALTVIDGLDILCVDTIESARPVKFTMKRGAKLPLHAGAPGKALLAYTDSVSLQEVIQSRGFPKINGNTIGTLQDLEAELKAIRRQGYSRSDSEVAPGFTALAVPILNRKGSAMASLSIIGSAEMLPKEDQQTLIDKLKDASRRISANLG